MPIMFVTLVGELGYGGNALEHNKLRGFVVPLSGPTAVLASSRLAAYRTVTAGRLSLHDLYSLHHNIVNINAGKISPTEHSLALLRADFPGEG